MLKEFYRKALPNEGYYCVVYNNPGTKPYTHDYASSLEEVVELIEKHKKEGRNVFVAMSTLNEKKREASKSIFAKSFYIDLDVGENKEYASQKEALFDLSRFLETSKLPTPAIVNSGNGIHAYWFLKEQVSIDVWKPIAEKLKSYCVQENLKIDLAVTADTVRLLRCPDTNNYKQDPPRPTLVLRDADEINIKDIETILEDIEVDAEGSTRTNTMSEEERKRKYGNYEN